jgi:hypothetical protein
MRYTRAAHRSAPQLKAVAMPPRRKRNQVDHVNVPLSLSTAQAAAMDQLRFDAHHESRSASYRVVIRAGLVALAESAQTERERSAAAAALVLWDATTDATPPTPQE